MKTKNLRAAIVATVAVFLMAGCTCSLAACTNSDLAREQMRNESENNCGVMRTVTVYSQTGEKIDEWHGQIDVEYVCPSDTSHDMDRVDIVIFDGTEPVDRVIVSGGIVIVDDDRTD